MNNVFYICVFFASSIYGATKVIKNFPRLLSKTNNKLPSVKPESKRSFIYEIAQKGFENSNTETSPITSSASLPTLQPPIITKQKTYSTSYEKESHKLTDVLKRYSVHTYTQAMHHLPAIRNALQKKPLYEKVIEDISDGDVVCAYRENNKTALIKCILENYTVQVTDLSHTTQYHSKPYFGEAIRATYAIKDKQAQSLVLKLIYAAIGHECITHTSVIYDGLVALCIFLLEKTGPLPTYDKLAALSSYTLAEISKHPSQSDLGSDFIKVFLNTKFGESSIDEIFKTYIQALSILKKTTIPLEDTIKQIVAEYILYRTS